jgi:DNA-3-methyladenine glycosylase II
MAQSMSATKAAETPEYWEEACKQLSKRDAVLKRLIKQHAASGHVGLRSRGDAFSTLCRSVVGQQISVKAADSVWAKFSSAVEKVQPARVLAVKPEELRASGLSMRKVEYVRDLAVRFDDGTISPKRWRSMEDEAVIEELVAVRGIGRWTAEMFLIFYLLRPNIFPLDDLGLMKGLSQAYSGGDAMSRNQARDIAELWAPWATVGTWYIWRSLDPTPVEY